MSQDLPMVVTTNVHRVEPVQPEVLASHTELATPTPEQIEAANGLFAQHAEADLVAGMFGMWTGTLVLADLTAEMLRPDQDERTQEKRRPEDRLS